MSALRQVERGPGEPSASALDLGSRGCSFLRSKLQWPQRCPGPRPLAFSSEAVVLFQPSRQQGLADRQMAEQGLSFSLSVQKGHCQPFLCSSGPRLTRARVPGMAGKGPSGRLAR